MRTYIHFLCFILCFSSVLSQSDSIVRVALLTNDQEPERRFNEGVKKYLEQDYEGALERFSVALELKNDLERAIYMQGMCSFSLKKYQEAISFFQKSLEIQKTADTYYYLGECVYKLDDKAQSLSYFSKAIQLNPKNGDAYYRKGVIFLEQQEYDLALMCYDSVLGMILLQYTLDKGMCQMQLKHMKKQF